MSLNTIYRNKVIAGLLGTFAFYIAAYIDMAVTGVPLNISAILISSLSLII